jgi:hypothetical protein
MGKEVGKPDEPIRFGHDIEQIQDAIAALDQAFDAVHGRRLRLGRQPVHRKEPPVLVRRRGRQMHMRVARQITVELAERLRKPVTQGVQKRPHLDGLLERLVVGRALRLLGPVCRQILTRIAESIGPLPQ